MTSMGFDVDRIRNELARKGYVDARDRHGRKLYLVMSSRLPEHPPGVLIAYEGYGAMFYDLKAPLNKFRLISHGFTYTVAYTLALVLNDIFGFEYHVTVRVPLRRNEAGESLIEHRKE